MTEWRAVVMPDESGTEAAKDRSTVPTRPHRQPARGRRGFLLRLRLRAEVDECVGHSRVRRERCGRARSMFVATSQQSQTPLAADRWLSLIRVGGGARVGPMGSPDVRHRWSLAQPAPCDADGQTAWAPATIRCEIFPADLDATADFYVNELGFRVVRRRGAGPVRAARARRAVPRPQRSRAARTRVGARRAHRARGAEPAGVTPTSSGVSHGIHGPSDMTAVLEPRLTSSDSRANASGESADRTTAPSV